MTPECMSLGFNLLLLITSGSL